MIDWLPRHGSLQESKDRRFMIQHVTEEWWVAYDVTRGHKIGEFHSDAEARQACEGAV